MERVVGKKWVERMGQDLGVMGRELFECLEKINLLQT
jgi:hypothetical protein